MKIIIEPNQLTIKLEGFEQVWALKRRIQIPRDTVLDVDFLAQEPAMQDYRGFLRFPGTAIPGYFLAGSYNRQKKHEFWYVRMHQPGVLVITLKQGSLNYDKIRVTSTPEIAQSVADWWQERRK